ncbi:MAG: transcription elongation factor GreA [Oscillospiraceae bacterium]|nr:transcription elongation factor GreA [Oscillospiraceae bacterium]
MEKKRRMSREGYENLKRQLDHLINVERVDVAQKLKEARSYGDLSENAEYDEAKNEQAVLEAKIAETQYILDNAEIVEDTGEDLEEIDIGVVMTIRKVGTDKTEQLKIVGTNEANFLEHKISDESPIGKAAMKKKVGDIFIVEAPSGQIEYEVIEIAREIQKEA